MWNVLKSEIYYRFSIKAFLFDYIMHLISITPFVETYLPILFRAVNKSTNGLATFAVRRTWRLRTLRIDIAIHRRDVDTIPFQMRLQSDSHGRIGQILQPRSQREFSTCAHSLSSPCPDQGSKESLPGEKHRCCRQICLAICDLTAMLIS